MLTWHLSQELTEPILVVAASPRMYAPAAVDGLRAIIDQGFDLLVGAMLQGAQDQRAWVLTQLPTGSAQRRAEKRLGALCFDIEGQAPLRSYLEVLYGKRVNVSAARGSVATRLRLSR